MRIGYIGNFRPSWSTENHVRLSLEELGHEVIQFQEDKHQAEAVLGTAFAEQLDLLFWTRTWGIQGDSLAMLKHLPCPSVAYHLDLYAGLKRAAMLRTEPWWKSDYVFTTDNGSSEFWEKHKVKHYYLPPGVYGKECYLAEPDPEIKQDVIFTGSYGYHSEWAYRPLLIDNLREHYKDRFTLYEHSSGRRGHSLNVLYASVGVVVGDSCCIGFDHPYYWSDRVPEVLGRGGFLIHPRITGLEDDFTDGVHLVLYDYNNWDELYEKIDYYRVHPEEREKIRLAGHEQVKANDTYIHRMQSVLEVVCGKD